MFSIPRLGIIVLLLGIGVAIGWTVNGWRLKTTIAEMNASYTAALAKSYKELRSSEKSFAETADKLIKDKNEKVKSLNSKLKSVTNQLQQREKRNDSNDTTTAAACSRATGAELSREDADFLAREAARADQITTELNYCITQYNSVRDLLRK